MVEEIQDSALLKNSTKLNHIEFEKELTWKGDPVREKVDGWETEKHLALLSLSIENREKTGTVAECDAENFEEYFELLEEAKEGANYEAVFEAVVADMRGFTPNSTGASRGASKKRTKEKKEVH